MRRTIFALAKPTLSTKIRAMVAIRCVSSASASAGSAKSSATNASPVADLRQSARNFVSNPIQTASMVSSSQRLYAAIASGSPGWPFCAR